MISESFVVGCNSISVYGGVVVLDLMGLSPTERDAQGQPSKEMRQRIIMTPQATLETFNAMQGLMARLEQQGLVKRTGPTDTPASVDAPEEESDRTKQKGKKDKSNGQPKTPNF